MRKALPALVVLLGVWGLTWAAIAVLDPYRPYGRLAGPLVVFAALSISIRRHRRPRLLAFATALALSFSVAGGSAIEFRGDSASYFAYLRSVAFDRDLDFRNEWERFGQSPGPNGTRNVFSAGPALVWSPFYLAAHVYVLADRWLGGGVHEADGFSIPYRRATLLATVTVVLLGYSLLYGMLAALRGRAVAALSVTACVLASPVLYYTFHVPAMSHGVASGMAAAFLWAWDRARRAPSPLHWTLLGGTFGLLAACRWQCAVYGVLVALLAIDGFRYGRIRGGWLFASAAAAVLAFSPQLIIWKLQFGEALVIPQGRGFLDFSSPHWLDTLVSADHGFFNWTPLMLLGFVGLVTGLRESPMLHGGALVILGLTAWINGSVPYFDWAAGDAFGARRYTEVVPLMVLGVASLVDVSSRVLRRQPLLAPAAALGLLVLWNLGLVSHFRARKYPDAAPLERVARDQAKLLSERAKDALGVLAGARGRALAYKVFSGEYFYAGLDPSGTIRVRTDERFLLHGWHTPSRRMAKPPFRRALFPEACVVVPLEEPFALRVSVSARAPDGLFDQTLALVVNDREIGSAPLGIDWQEIPFLVPEESLLPGENVICLRFAKGLSDGEGPRVAAMVEKIQLP
jgi:hypothetical protein